MREPIVVFDACVLYPAPLRDLLLSLAQSRLFRARWTDEILDEWIHSLSKARPDIAGFLPRTRELMNAAVPDCLVTGYRTSIVGLTLPDPNDRHVLAAAITAKASLIVTYNVKDFPDEHIRPFGVRAKHPDEFVSGLFERNPLAVAAQVRALRMRLRNPPMSVDDLLDRYLVAGLRDTVAGLHTLVDLL